MKKLVPVNEFCANHQIEISFIRSLQDNGLIEIITIEEALYIPSSRLQDLERIVRLYYELDINLEGIETINHLLQQINHMQNEIITLRNRLRFFETIENK